MHPPRAPAQSPPFSSAHYPVFSSFAANNFLIFLTAHMGHHRSCPPAEVCPPKRPRETNGSNCTTAGDRTAHDKTKSTASGVLHDQVLVYSSHSSSGNYCSGRHGRDQRPGRHLVHRPHHVGRLRHALSGSGPGLLQGKRPDRRIASGRRGLDVHGRTGVRAIIRFGVDHR